MVASKASDPDIAPFVGPVHLGECFVLWREGEIPLLGYLTPMERDEAAASGCRLLDPEVLQVRQLRESLPSRTGGLAELLRRAFDAAGWAPGAIDLAGRSPSGDVVAAARELEAEGWRFESGHASVLRRRKTKSEVELGAARHAASGAASALRAVAQLLAAAQPAGRDLLLEGEPLTIGRLRTAAAGALAAYGLDQPLGNIFALGRDAAVPHTSGPSERRVQRGESLIVDLFPCGALFADCTRTFCHGEAPPALAAAHARVLEALHLARRHLTAGKRGWDLQLEVCRHFEDAGYPTPRSHPGTEAGYVHNLGHGVGYELHELPSFREDAGGDGLLAADDLLTLEPGLYDPAAGWGVRLEDLLHLAGHGAENLTPVPYELDPRAWSR